jgi:hypothetical protein
MVRFLERKQNGGCHGQRGGENEDYFNDYRALVLQDEKSSGDGLHINVKVPKSTEVFFILFCFIAILEIMNLKV